MVSNRMIASGLAGGLVAFLMLASAAAFGQGNMDKLKSSTPAERATLQTMMMKEKLGLTPQQLPTVREINLETATQMQPVLTGSEGPLIKMRKAKTIEGQRDARAREGADAAAVPAMARGEGRDEAEDRAEVDGEARGWRAVTAAPW